MKQVQMNIQQNVLDGITILAPAGRIDTTTSGPFEEAVRTAVDGGARDVVVEIGRAHV